MATKQRPTRQPRKPGRTVKEKRSAKQEKQAVKKQSRRSLDGK